MSNFIKYIIYGSILFFSTASFPESGNTIPLLKNISSCELDLNKDGNSDIALLIETVRGREVIVLMRHGNGYNSFIIRADSANMNLSCHFGESIQETQAGKRNGGKVYKTMGTYIKLIQPEGASVAYFWDGAGFSEVWTSD